MKIRNWLSTEQMVRAKDDFDVIPKRDATRDFHKIPKPPGRPKGSTTTNPVKPAKKKKSIGDDPALREMVKMMTACGVAKVKQARFLRISIGTLNNNFQHELENGEICQNMQVAQALFKKAIEGDVRAQIFWLESKGGFQKVTQVDVNTNAADNMSITEKGQRLAALMLANPEIMAKFKPSGPLPAHPAKDLPKTAIDIN